VPRDSLSVVDNRTGAKYELEIKDDCISATQLGTIKSSAGEVLRSFDPAYMNTVCCVSRISFIDGDNGILEYRGYPIEQLAEHASFLEVSFLVVYGELPTPEQLEAFTKRIKQDYAFNPKLLPFIQAFEPNCHPMGML
jgi:citrate synthase